MMRLYAAEDRRIRGHLAGALRLLRSADPSRLGRTQRRNRAAHIAALDAYMRAGRYPRSTAWGGSMLPALVDPFGTRCALAHLIERSGGEELVDRLRSVDNHAFVRELAGDEALLAWLEEAGLTAAEAARIQPSYTPPSSPFLCACRDLRHGPVFIGRVETRDDLAGSCEVLIGEVIANRTASASGEGAPTLASTALVADCGKAAVGAQVLVTRSDEPTDLKARPVMTSNQVVFEACYFGGAHASSPLPLPEAVSLAQIRKAHALDDVGCMEILGAPAELIPAPHSPRRLPRTPANDRFEVGAGGAGRPESSAVSSTAPSDSSSGYYFVFGGMIVAGTVLAVVWVRRWRG